ncbi:MAG: Nif3-like dinuclear metal center hexameric protein [Bacteroidales bacterium]|nr:Nif3-like dinuclear metal center hexameric protein [Bacteroidales bacterium]
MKAKDVAAVIERFAPLSTQEGWDNAGFIIGSREAEVHAVIVGFDCTPELISEAERRGADMIVTHHPLIFKGVKNIYPDNWLGATIGAAVSKGIVVYAAHTNADKAAGGVSDLMAARLGLTGCEPLSPEGLGVVGNLPAAMSAEDFIAMVKERFSLKVIRHSRPGGPIRRVAVCGGSGGSLISCAEASGADAYVSADFSYHEFFANPGFMVMDIGHYESEIDIVEKLLSILRENLDNFAVFGTDNKNNPVYYS